MIKPSIRSASVCFLIYLIAVCPPWGCAQKAVTGSLRVQSLGDSPVLLTMDFSSSVFDHDPQTQTTFWLSDAPVEDLLAGRVKEGQIIHLDLLWIPRAGSTPMDSSATNASIRYIVISHGQVGVYIGAGFALPDGALDGSSVTISLRDASLKLVEATDGFLDLLSPAQLSGKFTAQRDPDKVRQLYVSISQFVTDALGRTRYVQNTENRAAIPQM